MAVVERRRARHRVHQSGHLQGPIVSEGENIVKGISRDIVARVDRVGGIPPEFPADLDRVRFVYPRESVLVIDSVLIPTLWPRRIPETGYRREGHRRNLRMRRRGVSTFVSDGAELEFVDL